MKYPCKDPLKVCVVKIGKGGFQKSSMNDPIKSINCPNDVNMIRTAEKRGKKRGL